MANNPYAHLTDEELEREYQQALAEERATQQQDLTKLTDEELEMQYLQALKEENAAKEARHARASQGPPPSQDPLLDNIIGFGSGVAQGITDTATGALNLARRGYAAAMGKEKPHPITFDINELQAGGPVNAPTSHALGEFASILALPLGEISVLSKLAKSKGMMAKITAALGDIAGTGAGYGALYGANSEDDLSNTMGMGSALNLALSGPLRGAGALYNKMRPKIDVSPQKLKEMEEIMGDLPIDIGTMAGKGSLGKWYRNTVAKIPFSGAKEKMQEVVDAADKEERGILDYFKGGEDADELTIDNNLLKEVQNIYKENKSAVSKVFSGTAEEATKARIFVRELPEVQKYARELLKEIDTDKGLNFPTNLPFNKGTRKVLEMLAEGIPYIEEEIAPWADPLKLAAQKSPKETSGLSKGPGTNIPEKYLNEISIESEHNPFKGSSEKREPLQFVKKQATFDRADKVRKFFSEYARKHRLDQNQTLASVYSKLERAAQQDLEGVLTNAGRPDLARAWKKGREGHATGVQPFRRPAIYRILKGKESPEKLAAQLISPENRFIYESLSPQGQKSAVFKHLNQGDLLRRARGLGAQGRDRLLSPTEIKRLSKLEAMRQITKEYMPILKTPHTGVQAADLLKLAGIAGAGWMAGGNSESSKTSGALLSALSAIAAGRLATKSLTGKKALQKAAQPDKQLSTAKAARLAAAITHATTTRKPMELELTRYQGTEKKKKS